MTHRMARLDDTGHTLVEWELDDPESVAEAEHVFNQERKAGYAAFRETSIGSTELLLNFDPNAKNTLLVPPMVGG